MFYSLCLEDSSGVWRTLAISKTFGLNQGFRSTSSSFILRFHWGILLLCIRVWGREFRL